MEYRCYYIEETGERCTKVQKECWCSDLHRKKWQEKNYPEKKTRVIKKEITSEFLRQKIKDLQRTSFIINNTEKSGQIKLMPLPPKKRILNEQEELFDH